MVKFIGLMEKQFNINIKSKRILKKRLKVHSAINTIKKKFKKHLKNRYSFLKNNLDDELFSCEKVYMIPKDNLMNIKMSNNQIMGCKATNLLKWYNTFDYYKIPRNIFTNNYDINSNVEKCINKVDKYINKYKIKDKNLINSLVNLKIINKQRKSIPNNLKLCENYVFFHYNKLKFYLVENCNFSNYFKNKIPSTIDSIEFILLGCNLSNLSSFDKDIVGLYKHKILRSITKYKFLFYIRNDINYINFLNN